MWKVLSRKVPDHVKANKDRHSMLYVPNGFFVNMEYHNEFSYWDAYWIMRGIIALVKFYKYTFKKVRCSIKKTRFVLTV